MKRNFDEPLRDLDGNPFNDGATLKAVAVASLITTLDDDRAQTADEKVRLFGLAQRVSKGGVVELTAEELGLLKSRIGKMYGVLVVGQAFSMLDADYVEPTPHV